MDFKKLIETFRGKEEDELILFLIDNVVKPDEIIQILCLKSFYDSLQELIGRVDYLTEEIEDFHKEYRQNQHY